MCERCLCVSVQERERQYMCLGEREYVLEDVCLRERVGVSVREVLVCVCAKERKRRRFTPEKAEAQQRPCLLVFFTPENWLIVSSIRGQFHQCSTSSFYACRSQKHKKDSQVIKLLCVFGICASKSCF